MCCLENLITSQSLDSSGRNRLLQILLFTLLEVPLVLSWQAVKQDKHICRNTAVILSMVYYNDRDADTQQQTDTSTDRQTDRCRVDELMGLAVYLKQGRRWCTSRWWSWWRRSWWFPGWWGSLPPSPLDDSRSGCLAWWTGGLWGGWRQCSHFIQIISSQSHISRAELINWPVA